MALLTIDKIRSTPEAKTNPLRATLRRYDAVAKAVRTFEDEGIPLHYASANAVLRNLASTAIAQYRRAVQRAPGTHGRAVGRPKPVAV